MNTKSKSIKAVVLTAAILLVASLSACSGGVEEKVYEIKEQSSLKDARQLLEQYANGQALGSEGEDFERLVTSVRETHSQEADILEKAFADIKAKPASRASIAKQALAKLPK